ncbi:MAG: hypothetical protein GY737_12900 [Desulfobacteraceae bacterium]|nr:hypothetical protein [Desulfobacteraceae bacterium]
MTEFEKAGVRRVERITYRDGEEEFLGLFSTPGGTCPPLVVLFHEYLGMEEHMTDKAMDLIDRGFAVFVADLYGREIRPRNHGEAYPHYRFLKSNPRVMDRRARLGVDQAMACIGSQTHPCMAVLGFSMGGWAALGVARSCPWVRLAVSVYGYLNALTGLDSAPCDLLIIHGLKDRIVPREDLTVFRDLAGRPQGRCELVLYDRAGHGFCNPSLEPDPALGNFYDREYHEKAWQRIVAALEQMRQTNVCNSMLKTNGGNDG